MGGGEGKRNFSPIRTENNWGYLPLSWENRKFRLENQMVRAIPFGKLQTIWTVKLIWIYFVVADRFPTTSLDSFMFKRKISPGWF